MQTKQQKKENNRKRRHARVRAKISGTANRPRLAVYTSNTAVYAQLIDDTKGATLASSISKGMKGKTLTDRARQVGESIAKEAHAKKISTVVFDRGGFAYTGRVRALAEGAREGGLQF